MKRIRRFVNPYFHTTMDSFTISSELPASRADWLHLEDPLPDLKIRIKTVQKTCQGPFLPAHKLPRKQNWLSRGQLPALKREKTVLPYLCPVALQGTRKSPRTEAEKKSGNQHEERSMLLRGNSVEFDGKPKPVVHHKHSLSSISQPIALRAKYDFSPTKLIRKNAFVSVVPEITVAEVLERPALGKANKSLVADIQSGKLTREKQGLLTAHFSASSIGSKGALTLPKSSKLSGKSANESCCESQTEDFHPPLTPFHHIIDMTSESKAHTYLCRTLPVASIPQIPTLDAIQVKTMGKMAVKCTCAHPVHNRNMKLFALRGFNSIRPFPHYTVESHPSIERVMRPIKLETSLPVLLIHLEGVLVAFKSREMFNNTAVKCWLRPGTIAGLRLLARTFNLVLLITFEAEKMYKILEFLLQSRVQFQAVYVLKAGLDCRKEPSFLHYEAILRDLELTQPAEQQVALLCALDSEPETKDESCLYTCTGLGVRLHARYLPVIQPVQGQKPLMTFLVQHLATEDQEKALLFTVISREIVQLYDPDKGWIQAFYAFSSLKSPVLHFILTNRVHEAYFSSLLPPLMSETLSCYQTTEISPGSCAAHPRVEALCSHLPQNLLVLLASSRVGHLARVEVVDSELFPRTAKRATLLDFATTIE